MSCAPIAKQPPEWYRYPDNPPPRFEENDNDWWLAAIFCWMVW